MNKHTRAAALLLTLALLLSACGGKNTDSENTVTVETREETRELAAAFYAPLYNADPISFETYSGGQWQSTFSRDGDAMHAANAFSDDEYYMFVEDGQKYLMSDGETAYADENGYNMYADTLDTTLSFYVMGILRSEEGEAPLSYHATRTDRTTDGVSSSELVYTVSGEAEGESVTLTVTGTADGEGNVSRILYEYVSGENKGDIELRFSYDVSVQVPEHTYGDTGEIEYRYTHVESPFATIQDLIDRLGEDEYLNYTMTDGAVLAFGEKDGRLYQVRAEISPEAQAAYDALDFFSETYDEDCYAIVGALSIVDCIDYTDSVIPQSELDAFVGKTAQEIADAGFEGTGWSFYEGSGALFFAKDGMGYTADATAPADFDMDSEFEFEDLLGFTVEGFRFNAPERTLPMD